MDRLPDNPLSVCKGCAEKISSLEDKIRVVNGEIAGMSNDLIKTAVLQVENKQEAKEGLKKVETLLEEEVGPNHHALKSTVKVLIAKVADLEKTVETNSQQAAHNLLCQTQQLFNELNDKIRVSNLDSNRFERCCGEEMRMAMCQIAGLMSDLAQVKRNQNSAMGLPGPADMEGLKQELSSNMASAAVTQKVHGCLLKHCATKPELDDLDKKFTISCSSHAADLQALKTKVNSLHKDVNQTREGELNVGLAQGIILERMQSELEVQKEAIGSMRQGTRGVMKDAKDSMLGVMRLVKAEILDEVKAMISKERAERASIEEFISASMEPLGDKLGEAITQGTHMIRVGTELKHQEQDNIIGKLQAEVLRLMAYVQAHGLVADRSYPEQLKWQKANNVTVRASAEEHLPKRKQLPSQPSRPDPVAEASAAPAQVQALKRKKLPLQPSRPDPVAEASAAPPQMVQEQKQKQLPAQPSRPEPVAKASAATAHSVQSLKNQLPSQPSRRNHHSAEVNTGALSSKKPAARVSTGVSNSLQSTGACHSKKRPSAVIDANSAAKRQMFSIPGCSLGDAGYILCDGPDRHGNAGAWMKRADEAHAKQRAISMKVLQKSSPVHKKPIVLPDKDNLMEFRKVYSFTPWEGKRFKRSKESEEHWLQQAALMPKDKLLKCMAFPGKMKKRSSAVMAIGAPATDSDSDIDDSCSGSSGSSSSD